MKNLVTVILLSTAWTMIANAQDSGREFTLKGKNSYQPSQECFLYVDRFGVDASLPQPHKFFAEVRTSFEPQKSILLVTTKRFEMTSINREGQITNELKLRLRAPANEQVLRHAANFYGISYRPPQRFSCAMLQSIEVEPVN